MSNRLKWIDGRCFVGETASGHALVMDGGVEHGGRNRGARPMGLLLHGAAGCMAYDGNHHLEKSREDLRDLWIELTPLRHLNHRKCIPISIFILCLRAKL